MERPLAEYELSEYIYDRSDWPNFTWERPRVAEALAMVHYQQGRLLGRMENLGFPLQQNEYLQTLVQDVLKSSEIEGEHLDSEMVRSSVARRLGMDIVGLRASDRNVDGVVEMVLDATQDYQSPLTAERLFRWHTLLFPTGKGRIRVGAWRNDAKGPMQVVSGPIGRERVHFQAPAEARLDAEMARFLDWFNAPVKEDWVIRAAVAHLWFLTLHPFEDGNGRIARAITDMALARSEQSSLRFYSMSAQLRVERKHYYDGLEQAQKGTMEITIRILWFLKTLREAIVGAQAGLDTVMAKSRFWESVAGLSLNERQHAMLLRLLDGFEGKLTTSKWALLTKCSQDTAARDIYALTDTGVLLRSSERGRSTSYSLRPL
jgi:Fic family protein